MRYFVSGIGTEVGKTVASALLVEAWQADYFKPIQSGAETDSDTETVRSLVSPLPQRQFWPEIYRLQAPLSPHVAAALEAVDIELEQLLLPQTTRPLVVEGAGGLLVPINERGQYIIDLPKLWSLPLVLVISHYLGNINHSLLSIEALQNRGIEIAALLFMGSAPLPDTEEYILRHTRLPSLGRVPRAEPLNRAWIAEQASILRQKSLDLGLLTEKR